MKKILCMVICVMMVLASMSVLAEGQKVGVSMPTKDLQRWNQDGAYMEEKLKEAGYEGGKAIITHTENEEAARNLKDLVLSSYPDANIQIFPTRGLCSYYMERKGVVISCEI